MPSIGDITGRITLQDVGSPAAIKFGENLEKVSKTITASMSRATLATETAVREIASKLAKLKTGTKDTAVGKGLVADLDSLIKKRQQEITALKAGPAAIEALNQKRYQEAQALKIAAAQVNAGVAAESYLGRTIAANIKTLDRYEKELDDLAKAQALAAKRTEQQVAAYRKLSDVGQTLTTRVTLPLVALGVGAVKVASDFESSFAGVIKTVDGLVDEYNNLTEAGKQLQQQLRDLAAGPDAIPLDVNKLNAVAEAAGQLGIAKQDIVAFTRTMADLGQTTNLTADEAATATAQFQNIFGAAGKEVDRFGSTLVALGNAGASTERDIISMGLRIAGAGVQLGLSQGQVLAYASALSSMGIEAEAGGSAISKVMIDIALAVSKGGRELSNFASVSGMSADQFKVAFKEDAAGAVASFIEGLGRMKSSGQDVLGTLDAMGITEIRMRDALLRASGAGDLLRNSLKLQGEAWKDNNALTSEAEKRYQTFESQLQLLWNRLKDVAITFGTALLPALLDAMDAAQPFVDLLKSMAEGFANSSPGFQKFVLIVGTLTAAVGPAVFITGQLLLAWSQIVIYAPGVAGALDKVALATKGLIVIGVLLFINEIIKAWGRAQYAVTQYNLEVAKIEGNALAFAQQVSQGALYSVITQADFDEKIKEAEILSGHIQRITRELDEMTMGGKLSEEDIRFSGIQPFEDFKAKQAELDSLWKTYGKLRTALAGVTIAGEEAEAAFNPSPFAGLAADGDKSIDILGDLIKQIERAAGAMELLREGEDITSIEALVSAAELLDKGNLFDSTVKQVGVLIEKLNNLTGAFDLAIEARKKLADAGGNLNDLIQKQFDTLGNDPEMAKLIATLREAKALTDSIKSDEQKRLEIIGRAQSLYEQGLITASDLQIILLANADQWNIELDETQLKFNEIYEKLSYIAEGIAYDLVYNWRRAWEENESITDATINTLKDSFLNVLSDLISQWLSQWFKAMAAWLARWIATQTTAKAASASLDAGSTGAGGGLGSLFGMGAKVGGGGTGVSTSTLLGAGLAAYALFVVYKGFIEDHKRKFARVEIIDGQAKMTAWHGKKYMAGVQAAAESIINNLKEFLSDIDVEMERLGTVIIESSKSGFNVKSSPTSTGKLFASMEEAIAYAQVLMLKYGEFADSVSTLVKGVITSTKAITIEDLASDISFARELETQNLEQSAAAIRQAMDLAIAQWKRAEDLFLSFYDRNLPAFAEAATSILTRLSNSIWAQYNQLAGIEEDPAKAWERKKAQYRAERAMIEAQLKLWKLEVEQRILNLKAGSAFVGGLGGITRGTLKFAAAMVQAAEVMDPALQALEDILAIINRTLNELPPLDLPDTDPGKKGRKGGGKGQLKDLREQLRDEIAMMEAEAKGPLHAAFLDLNQNIADFRERAKEAKLPAAELAKGVELLAEAFKRSVREQALAYAGLDNEISRRLREISDFFDEVRSLGPDATGISGEEADTLETEAFEKVGKELAQLIAEFAGLVDPMLAIQMRAQDLRESVLAYAEAAGWSAEQIDEALNTIDRGVEIQRAQGINNALGNLFKYLEQAGLYQQEAIEFERQKALTDLLLIEAQLRFYGALTAQTEEWLAAARDFVNSPAFGNNNTTTTDDVIKVRVVNPTNEWDDIVDRIKDLVESWREAVESFAESTKSLMTDEELTNLTQAEQLAFAAAQLEELSLKAQGGDLEALRKLEAARAEYLAELRESESGGFGFDKGWDWAMGLTADVLKNAQAAEESLIAKELAKNIEAWAYVMDQLADQLETTLYDTTAQLIEAIYDAIGSVPSFASGGIVMSGPRLVRVAEYVPEAIVPLNKLSSLIPYSLPANLKPSPDQQRLSGPMPYDFTQRSALSRWSSIEHTNRVSASSLKSIRDDLNAMRRRRD